MMQFKSITIKATSCGCGGSYAWLGERPSGAWEMIGCVCHTPVRPEWLSGYGLCEKCGGTRRYTGNVGRAKNLPCPACMDHPENTATTDESFDPFSTVRFT